MRSRVAQAALAAGFLVGAACGSGDARPVASVSPTALQAHHRAQDVASPVALGERDRLPTRARVVPTTRASRSLSGGRTAEGDHSRAAMRQPTTGDVWARLAWCESRMRNLRNHPYSGYFQFTRPTWQSLGYSGEAADHDYGTQLEAAKRLLARSGPGQWPVCSRKAGL